MTIFHMLNNVVEDTRDCDQLSLDELEQGMIDTRTLINACRVAGEDDQAERHEAWLDALLDGWISRLATHPVADVDWSKTGDMSQR